MTDIKHGLKYPLCELQMQLIPRSENILEYRCRYLMSTEMPDVSSSTACTVALT